MISRYFNVQNIFLSFFISFCLSALIGSDGEIHMMLYNATKCNALPCRAKLHEGHEDKTLQLHIP